MEISSRRSWPERSASIEAPNPSEDCPCNTSSSTEPRTEGRVSAGTGLLEVSVATLAVCVGRTRAAAGGRSFKPSTLVYSTRPQRTFTCVPGADAKCANPQTTAATKIAATIKTTTPVAPKALKKICHDLTHSDSTLRHGHTRVLTSLYGTNVWDMYKWQLLELLAINTKNQTIDSWRRECPYNSPLSTFLRVPYCP